MNFLGHLYFSSNDLELMYANLFGDFVKGKAMFDYPEKIQTGIQLHRSIDTYIDTHQEVRKLLKMLYPDLPKVSSVAVDLFFDHLLAVNWKNYHSTELLDFLEDFYAYQPENWPFYSEKFKSFIAVMRNRKWMNSYQMREGLEKSCSGVGSRISFPNLLHIAPQCFDRFYDEIYGCFENFMGDAKLHFGMNKL